MDGQVVWQRQGDEVVGYQNSGGPILAFDLLPPDKLLTVRWGPETKPCPVCGRDRMYGRFDQSGHVECAAQEKHWSELGDQVYRSEESVRHEHAIQAAREAHDESARRQMRDVGIPDWKAEQIAAYWSEC